MADRPDRPPELPFGDPPSEPPAPSDLAPPETASPVATGPEPPAAEPPPASSIADGVERKLDPRSITASRLVGGIWLGVLAFINLVGISIFSLLGPLGAVADFFLFLGLIAIFGGLAALTWFGPSLRFKHASYRVDDEGIQIRQGIWWRSVVNVPRSRVQHTDVSQGPVERHFELGTLIIHTAGTQHASVPLSGLTRDAASAIRDHLIEGGDDDAV